MAIQIPSLPMTGTELKVTLDGLRGSGVVAQDSLAAMIADPDLTVGDRCDIPGARYTIVAAGSLTANGATVHDLTGIAGQAVLDRAALLPDLATLLADTRGYGTFAAGDRILLLSGERFVVDTSGAASPDLTTAGGLNLTIMAGEDNIAAYGVTLDGVTDDTAALRDLLEATGRIDLPRGVARISGTIEGETATKSWNGLYGAGHETVLRLDATGRIKMQNRRPGGALGVTHWASQGITDVTIDGQGKAAPYGVIVGTDTDSGETDIDLSCNGAQFNNVAIMNCEVGFACGFTTANTWINCFTRDCDYGWYIHSSEDFTAADMWVLVNPIANSHDIAAIAVVSESVNAVTGTIAGGMINDNAGWGAVFAGTVRDSYTLTGTHFESNGSEVNHPEASVTVKNLGLTAEPGHLYADNVNLTLNGCAFYGGFIQAVNGATLKFDGGAIYTGTSGADFLEPFKGTDETATLSFGGGLTLTNPSMSTDATILYDGEVRIAGTSNDKLFIGSRIPKGIKAKPAGILNDPSFESNQSGFTASNTPPVNITRSTANPFLGNRSLRVTYSGVSGAHNTNALVHSGIDTLGAGEYIAFSFFVYSNKATVLRAQTFTNEYGNNMGAPVINVPNKEWIRVGVLWRNRSLTAEATGVLVTLWPESTNAPMIDLDCVDLSKGSYADVQPTLQGFVGLI